MSITRNRELSQFGSFIYINDETQSIGITTEATPFIGIGTTNPNVKLEVIGDTNIDGDLTVIGGNIDATSFTLNGNPLVDANVEYWVLGSNNLDIYRPVGNIGIGTATNLSKLTVNGQIHSQASQGTAPFIVNSTTVVQNLNASLLGGKSAPIGDIVGTTATQTLTGKTINLSNNTLSGTLSQFNAALTDTDFVSINGTQTLTNKTLTTPVISSISNSGIQIVPTGNGTLVSTNSVGVINQSMLGTLSLNDTDISANAQIQFSKISTSGAGNSIVNSDISDGTIQNVKLVNSTVSGIPLGSNLNSLIPGTYLIGNSYNGSTQFTWSVNATSSNNASTIVARDSNGDFTAGTVTVTDINAETVTATSLTVGTITATDINAGIVTATDFNSISDIKFKTNIKTINNALDITNKLRGVSFDWKETNKKSYGVIAQEIEEILPDLIKNGEVKSVNYNGLIGVLIEAVKELSLEVEELKKQINK